MNLRKIAYTTIVFLLFSLCLVGCGAYLSEEDKEAIISNQVNSMSSIENEMEIIWDSYADDEGLMTFPGYLDTNGDSYKASQEMREVIAIYETEIMSESNKIDKNKVEDSEFLAYLDNVNEYILAINNYVQAMEDGNSDKFSDAKENIERYSRFIINYAETELNN